MKSTEMFWKTREIVFQGIDANIFEISGLELTYCWHGGTAGQVMMSQRPINTRQRIEHQTAVFSQFWLIFWEHPVCYELSFPEVSGSTSDGNETCHVAAHPWVWHGSVKFVLNLLVVEAVNRNGLNTNNSVVFSVQGWTCSGCVWPDSRCWTAVTACCRAMSGGKFL